MDWTMRGCRNWRERKCLEFRPNHPALDDRLTCDENGMCELTEDDDAPIRCAYWDYPKNFRSSHVKP